MNDTAVQVTIDEDAEWEAFRAQSRALAAQRLASLEAFLSRCRRNNNRGA
ncbi:MAG TPA: hypothetical protein VNS79_02280 [Sphingobium sp.]|nr:hypothetical protein [Sphingobium sp.]